MTVCLRTLYGAAALLCAIGAVVIGSQLPAGVVPPVSTVLLIVAAPIAVVGGAAALRILRRYLDDGVGSIGTPVPSMDPTRR